MARSRNIKPGFFINDKLAEINPLGRLLFAGLWTIADREGRLEDRPKKIKAEILPYDDCDIDKLLTDLNSANFIIRYSVDEEAYIQIINFNLHQNPHKNETNSVIPPLPEQNSTSTVQVQEMHTTNRADSLNLIPDSLNLIPDSSAPDGAEKVAPAENSLFEESEGAQDEANADPGKGNEYSAEFEEFWAAYPRRKEKQAAFACWKARKKDGHLPRDMLAAAKGYAAECLRSKTEEQYIKLCKTFLGPRRPFLEYVPDGKVVNMDASRYKQDDYTG
jgi:hypothetical protein